MLNEQNIPSPGSNNINPAVMKSINPMQSHSISGISQTNTNTPMTINAMSAAANASSTKSFETFFKSASEDLPTIQVLEKRYIELVLEKTRNRKDKASAILGINRRTLYRKEREYGLTNYIKQ